MSRMARNFDEQCKLTKRDGKVNWHCQRVEGHPDEHLFGDGSKRERSGAGTPRKLKRKP